MNGSNTTLHSILVTINIAFFAPCTLFLASMSIVMNGLVILGVLRDSSLYRSPIYLLCCVSSNDLLWGVVYSITKIIHLTKKQFWDDDSPDRFPVKLLCFLTTIASWVLLSRDRYLAVSRPLRYRAHVTGSGALRAYLTVWLFCLLVVALAYVISLQTNQQHVRRIVGIAVGSASLLGILRYQIGILLAIKRHNRTMATQTGKRMEALLNRERKIAFAVTLAILANCLCFVPVLLIPTIWYFLGNTNMGILKPSAAFSTMLSGFITPLINYGKVKEIREGVLRFVKHRGNRSEAGVLGALHSTLNGQSGPSNAATNLTASRPHRSDVGRLNSNTTTKPVRISVCTAIHTSSTESQATTELSIPSQLQPNTMENDNDTVL